MTDNSKAPWDEMQTPDSGYTVRYVAAQGDIPLLWGKDVNGQCLFIIQLEGDHTHQYKKHDVSVNGIEIDLRQLPEPGKQGLILTLEKHVDRDLFDGLCQTLIDSLGRVSDPAAALSVALNHIKRWKAFLAGKSARILFAEEVRGLFAELSFLRVLKAEHLTDAQAVEAWCGPDRTHQDFIFGDTSVEVKSLSGRDRSVLRISSEDQLESVSEHLFLTAYRLTETQDAPGAQSLNELVLTLEHELSDAAAIEQYQSKLAAYGYAYMREYDNPRFLLTGSNTFRVAEGFPRLIRSELPDGAVNVRYSLQLEKLAPYECDQKEIWQN